MDKRNFLNQCKKLVIDFINFGETKVTEDKKALLEIIRKEIESTKIISVEGKHFDHLLKYLDNLWSISKGIVYNKNLK